MVIKVYQIPRELASQANVDAAVTGELLERFKLNAPGKTYAAATSTC